MKICAICGRIILAAWVWQGCHTLLQGYEGRGVHAAQQVAVEQCAGGAELVDIAVGGVGPHAARIILPQIAQIFTDSLGA